jgi:hypothetical protein
MTQLSQREQVQAQHSLSQQGVLVGVAEVSFNERTRSQPLTLAPPQVRGAVGTIDQLRAARVPARRIVGATWGRGSSSCQHAARTDRHLPRHATPTHTALPAEMRVPVQHGRQHGLAAAGRGECAADSH